MTVETPHTATAGDPGGEFQLPPTEPPHKSPLRQTTRRGIAAASFCLGLWGSLVFWWYPFGMAITGMALILATVSLLLGIRAGKDGEHLAAYALLIALTGHSLAWASYRFMMTAFEGQPGWAWFPFKLY